MVWVGYQWPIRGRKEGSVRTIIYFKIPHLFNKKRESVGNKKILEHQFGSQSGSSFRVLGNGILECRLISLQNVRVFIF